MSRGVDDDREVRLGVYVAARPVKPSFPGASRESRAARTHPGAPHGLTATHQDQVNADLLAFLRSQG
jgi:hypothetical protein